MSNLHIGDTAPDFTAQTTQGEINLYEYLGDSWGVLFSHPADFTPVCTTELGRVAKLADKFSSRDTKVLALSVDGIEDHEKWADDIEETQGARPDYPIIGDVGGKIADLYGMIPPAAENTQTVRSVFVIAPTRRSSSRSRTRPPPAATSTRSCASSTRSRSPRSTAWPPRPTGSRATTSSSPRPSPTRRPSSSSRASRPTSRTCAPRRPRRASPRTTLEGDRPRRAPIARRRPGPLGEAGAAPSSFSDRCRGARLGHPQGSRQNTGGSRGPDEGPRPCPRGQVWGCCAAAGFLG